MHQRDCAVLDQSTPCSTCPPLQLLAAGLWMLLLFACVSPPGNMGVDYNALSSMTPVVPTGHTHPVVAAAFGPDGKQVYSAGAGGRITAWETATGRELRSLFYQENAPVYSMLNGKNRSILLVHQADVFAFSPNGRMVATSGSEGRVCIWDTTTSRLLIRLPNRDERVSAMAFSPHSGAILTAGIEGTLALWELPGGRLIRSFRGSPFHAQGLSFSSNGRFALSTCADGRAAVWDVTQGVEVRTLDAAPESLSAAVITPDGRKVMGGCADGTVILWDAQSGKRAFTLPGEGARISAVAVSPDGRTAVAGDLEGSLSAVDLQDGVKTLSRAAHEGGVKTLTFSRDGRVLLSGGKDRAVKLWHASGINPIRTLAGTALPVRSVDFSPDGRFAATGAGNGVQVWDLETGERVSAFRGHWDHVTSVRFSRDGKGVFSTDRQGITRFRSLASGRDLPLPEGPLPIKNDATAYTPDRQVFLSIKYGEIIKRDAATGDRLGAIEGDAGYLSALAVAPSGRYYLTGSLSGLMKTHALSMGGLFSLPKTLEGHRGEVHSLAFSPDGTRILSGSEDRTARLWDARTGEELVRLVASRDGEWIVSTPDGYYNNSPEGSGLIHYLAPGGEETFSFEQFESRFKRPDILRERLQGNLLAGKPTPAVTRPPTLILEDHGEEVEIRERTYSMTLRASSEGIVRTVRVFVNGKPVREVSVDAKRKDINARIPVFAGINRITVLAYDGKGFSSNPGYVDVRCSDPALDKPDLHILAVGVSRYPRLSREYQLEFAHRDAEAITAALRKQEGRLFEKVHAHLLTDQQATVRAVTEVLESWRDIPPNDLVVLFMAGHGVREQDGTFYFLTSEGLMDRPQTGGLSWKVLRSHLQENRGRVALLLDACHSGGIVRETVVPNDELAHRFFSEGRGGIMVFSASKGRQFSLESPDVGGGAGVFTHAVVQTLGPLAVSADRNRNGVLEFSELVDHVRQTVHEWTDGAQTPWLSRKELFGDVPVAMVDRP